MLVEVLEELCQIIDQQQLRQNWMTFGVKV